MKAHVCALAALFIVAGTGSASAQKINVDSDRSVDFSKFNTFGVQLHPEFTPQNPLMAQRAIKGVGYHLTLEGLTEVQESPDLQVVVYAILGEEKQLHVTGYGYGAGWRMGGGTSTATTTTYTVGTLVVDMYDARTKELAFRGTAHDTLSDKPEKNEKKLNKALEKLFDKYPPEKK